MDCNRKHFQHDLTMSKGRPNLMDLDDGTLLIGYHFCGGVKETAPEPVRPKAREARTKKSQKQRTAPELRKSIIAQLNVAKKKPLKIGGTANQFGVSRKKIQDIAAHAAISLRTKKLVSKSGS